MARTKNAFLVLFMMLCTTVQIFAQGTVSDTNPAIIKTIQPFVVVIIPYDADGMPLPQGNGFFVADGIITERQVLDHASRAVVQLHDGKIYPIETVLADDAHFDLLLIKANLPAGVVHPLPLSEAIPELNDDIFVVGSSSTLDNTVFKGRVTEVKNDFMGKLIQISIPISPDFGGAPIANLRAEVIGMAAPQLLIMPIIEGRSSNFLIPAKHIKELKKAPQSFYDWAKANKESRVKFGKEFTQEYHLYSEAMDAISSGDCSKALPLIHKYSQSALLLKPREPVLLSYAGDCYLKLGRSKEAIDSYKQAIQINPNAARAHQRLGDYYDGLGRANEAMECYKKAIECDTNNIRYNPNDDDAYYSLGYCYDRLGRTNEAVESYKQVIRIKPDFSGAHFQLGSCYEKLDRMSEAIEGYKQAIRIEPDFAFAYRCLADCYYKLDRTSEAIEGYKQAIRIEPNDSSAQFLLGLCYSNLGRTNEEIECYKQAIRIKPDYVPAHFNLGICYLSLNMRGMALDEYKILKDLDHERADKLFNMIYK